MMQLILIEMSRDKNIYIEPEFLFSIILYDINYNTSRIGKCFWHRISKYSQSGQIGTLSAHAYLFLLAKDDQI